jgi:hypothetical protein
MTNKELKSLVKLMRSNGILSLKVNGAELLLSPEALFPQSKSDSKFKPQQAEELANIPAQKQYTDEEIMFWSAPNLEEAN